MRYKKFQCVKCGTEWFGYAEKPRCRKCGSKMINIFPAIIDEEKLKDLGAKIIKEKFEEKKQNAKMENNNKAEIKEDLAELNEGLLYGGSDLETENSQEDEEVTFKCSSCGADWIKKGDLYCEKCGSALDVDWSQY